MREPLTRREILKRAAAASAGLAVWRAVDAEAPAAAPSKGLTRPIPSSGERLPVVGLGTNRYGVSEADELAARKAVLERLAEVGGAVIDTAPAYGTSEAVLGDLLQQLEARDRFFLATKVTAEDGDAKAALAMLHASLERLKTQRLDLVQVHSLKGVEVLLPVLDEWKKAGKLRYVGITTSNPSDHPKMAGYLKKHSFDFIQVDYSLGNRAAAEEVLPLAQEQKVAVLVNLPLGGRRGSLFEKVADKKLPAWAAEFDARSWSQFFLKYCLSHPAVTCVIPGTTKVEHLEDNLQAATGALPDAAMRKRMEAFWDN